LKTKFLVSLIFLSILLAGCSAIDDVDDAARFLANYSDDAVRIIDKGDDAGRIVVRNQRWLTPMRNNLDDAIRAASKTTSSAVNLDDVFNAARKQNVKSIIDGVEDANRVKISAKLEDALNMMVKDTACLYLETAKNKQRLPTSDEFVDTLVETGAGELFKYAGFEDEFFFSVASEIYNLSSLKSDTPVERLQAFAFKQRYCGW